MLRTSIFAIPYMVFQCFSEFWKITSKMLFTSFQAVKLLQNCSKVLPRVSQDGPKMPPRAPKIAPRVPKTPPGDSTRLQRCLLEPRTRSQEAPKGSKRLPRDDFGASGKDFGVFGKDFGPSGDRFWSSMI